MAFSKMAGLDVTPSSPSRSTISASSPEVMSPRRMLSYQMDWPYFWTARSGLAIAASCGNGRWATVQMGISEGGGDGQRHRASRGKRRVGTTETQRHREDEKKSLFLRNSLLVFSVPLCLCGSNSSS